MAAPKSRRPSVGPTAAEWRPIESANLTLISSGALNATTYVDAAAFYQLTPGIRLSLDAINLTDEREEQVNSFNNGFGETGARRLWNFTTSGRTVFVGANIQF